MQLGELGQLGDLGDSQSLQDLQPESSRTAMFQHDKVQRVLIKVLHMFLKKYPDPRLVVAMTCSMVLVFNHAGRAPGV